jgi:hypothetical protein
LTGSRHARQATVRQATPRTPDLSGRQAWVSLNSARSPVECTVADISEIGAKIVVQLNMEIPQEFDLLLTPDGAVRRRCAVVWQSSDEIGLTFIGRKASRAAVAMVRYPASACSTVTARNRTPAIAANRRPALRSDCVTL